MCELCQGITKICVRIFASVTMSAVGTVTAATQEFTLARLDSGLVPAFASRSQKDARKGRVCGSTLEIIAKLLYKPNTI